MFKLRTLAALSLCAAGVATAAVLPGPIFGQDDAEGGAPQAIEPTDVHKMILEGVGEWTGTMTMTMPGMDPMKVQSTDTVKALGPYHTVSDFHCEFFGQKYHGHGILGYDPETKQMHGTWTDNMSPHTSFMRGTADLDSGRVEMKYMAPSPEGGEMIPHRNVTVHNGDSYTMTFFMGENDAEIQMMTLEMTRKK